MSPLPSMSSSSVSITSSNVSHCADEAATDWFCALSAATNVGLDCPSDDEGETDRGGRYRSLELQARLGGIAVVEDIGSFMCTEANIR